MTRRKPKPDLLGAMLEELGPLRKLGATVQMPTGRTAQIEQFQDGRTVLLRYLDEDRSQVTISKQVLKKLYVLDAGGDHGLR